MKTWSKLLYLNWKKEMWYSEFIMIVHHKIDYKNRYVTNILWLLPCTWNLTQTVENLKTGNIWKQWCKMFKVKCNSCNCSHINDNHSPYCQIFQKGTLAFEHSAWWKNLKLKRKIKRLRLILIWRQRLWSKKCMLQTDGYSSLLFLNIFPYISLCFVVCKLDAKIWNANYNFHEWCSNEQK